MPIARSRFFAPLFAAGIIVAGSLATQANSVKHPSFLVFGAQMTVLVSTDETKGESSTIRMEIPAGGGPPAAHIHSREDETFSVTSGHFRFWHGKQVVNAGPGTVLYMPRHEPHQFLNVGTTPGELLVTIVPGNFQHFFEQVAARHLTMPKDQAEFIRLSTQYGVRLVPSLAPKPSGSKM